MIALTGLTENDYLLQNTIQYLRQRTITIVTIETRSLMTFDGYYSVFQLCCENNLVRTSLNIFLTMILH